MSWVDGARRDFLSSLTIRDDMIGHVEFLEEPDTQNFGKKKNRKGEEIDDIRVKAKVKYLGGSAMYKEENSFYPAKVNEEYTLWMSATMSGAMLDILGWKKGGPIPLMKNTSWKIWRGEYGRGGHRTYEAEILSGEYKPVPAPDPVKKEEKLPVEYVPNENTLNELADAIKKLGEIDKATWAVFVQSKGVPTDKVDEITSTLVEKGLIYANSIKVSSKPID